MFESIIITGTSCAGKTSIVEKLIHNNNYVLVNAITTRDKRPDDTNYLYVTEVEFDSLKQNSELLTYSEYRGKKYGIRKNDYDRIINLNKIPVLIITSEACAMLVTESPNKYLSFFIDADDDTLINRLKIRNNRTLENDEKDKFMSQNKKDREKSSASHYILINKVIDDSQKLIEALWKYKLKGGGIPSSLIIQMIKCGVLLRNADIKKVNAASYDLSLGDEYYYDGEVNQLSDKKPFLTIEPYDYAIVSCVETAAIPRDTIAKFGLTVSLFCQGVILSNGPQIDPGFRGTLFCLLFNTSNKAIHLKRGQHYATIEFNRLIDFAPPYDGKYLDSIKIIDYIPTNALHGAINELKKEIEKLKNESKLMQNIYLGVCGLMFALISLLLIIP